MKSPVQLMLREKRIAIAARPSVRWVPLLPGGHTVYIGINDLSQAAAALQEVTQDQRRMEPFYRQRYSYSGPFHIETQVGPASSNFKWVMKASGEPEPIYQVTAQIMKRAP